MLESLRSFVGGWIAKILLGLLILSFAVWGVSGSILGGHDANTVARVGDTVVSPVDYMATYQNNLANIQRQTGQRLSREQARLFGVEALTLNNVISFATLDEFTRENGLALSDKTLAQLIADNQAFQDSTGKFNRTTFQRAIFNAQMRESDFIAAQNSSAVRNQITQAVAAGSILPSAFDEALASYIGEERVLAYIVLNETNITPPAPASDAQLDTYFQANKKTYDAPEYRKLTLLEMTPEILANEAEVTDEQIKADYESRSAAYRKPEQRRVQQIVFPSAEKAEEAKKTLADGGLFETVLSDNGRTVEDADLGLVSREQLTGTTNETFAKTAFELENASVSDVIQGPFGPTMMRVSEIVSASVTPLADVEAEIRKDLALRAAADRINELQERIEDSRAGGMSVADAAQAAGLTVRTLEAVDARGRDANEQQITDIPQSSTVLREAFRAAVGQEAPPIENGPAGFVWVDVVEITPTRERTLGEVKDKVAADWLAAEKQKILQAKAEEILKAYRNGGDLAALAAEASAEVKRTEALARNGRDAGLPQSTIAEAFNGDAKHAAVTPGDTPTSRIVVTVAEVKATPNLETPAEQAQAINAGAQDDLMTQFIGNLQSGYDVTHNPALIQQLLTQR
ncbi:MAG: SurA N-terminal domain-containing protein [Pseudomonadota bacterium]